MAPAPEAGSNALRSVPSVGTARAVADAAKAAMPPIISARVCALARRRGLAEAVLSMVFPPASHPGRGVRHHV